MYVNEIDERPEFSLISDSQDIEAILEYLGCSELKDQIGCMFVEIDNGDYGEIYYCEYSVPWLNARIYDLRGEIDQ